MLGCAAASMVAVKETTAIKFLGSTPTRHRIDVSTHTNLTPTTRTLPHPKPGAAISFA